MDKETIDIGKRVYSDKLGAALSSDTPEEVFETLTKDELLDVMNAVKKRAIKEGNPNAAQTYIRCREYLDRLNKPINQGELSAEDVATYGFRALKELQEQGYITVTRRNDISNTTEDNKTE